MLNYTTCFELKTSLFSFTVDIGKKQINLYQTHVSQTLKINIS